MAQPLVCTTAATSKNGSVHRGMISGSVGKEASGNRREPNLLQQSEARSPLHERFTCLRNQRVFLLHRASAEMPLLSMISAIHSRGPAARRKRSAIAVPMPCSAGNVVRRKSHPSSSARLSNAYRSRASLVSSRGAGRTIALGMSGSAGPSDSSIATLCPAEVSCCTRAASLCR